MSFVDGPRSPFGFAAAVTGLVAATAACVWLSWPRPDLTIQVALGSAAVVLPRYAARWRPATPLPLVLEVERGALVRVINDDTAWARLGIFSAPPHSADTERAPTVPGMFLTFCSAHPGRAIEIVVK